MEEEYEGNDVEEMVEAIQMGDTSEAVESFEKVLSRRMPSSPLPNTPKPDKVDENARAREAIYAKVDQQQEEQAERAEEEDSRL